MRHRSIFKVQVYALLDANGQVFYIGCTTQKLAYRLHAHKKYTGCNQKKVRRMKEVGDKVQIMLVEETDILASDATVAGKMYKHRERYWINYYLSSGVDLVNYESYKKRVAA